MKRRSATRIARSSCNIATSRYNQRRTLATALPYDMDHCRIRSFAKQHPEAARQVLSVPSTALTKSYDSNEGNPLLRSCGTLEQYLQWRGWDIDGILNLHNLGGDDEMLQSAVGLLSHPLTFPLTLGSIIQSFYRPLDNKHSEIHRQLRLCCVGARAECTLPDDYWREFLLAIFYSHQASRELHRKESFHCTIDFVGDDVPRNLKSRTITLLDNETQSTAQPVKDEYKLTKNYYSSFLHEVILDSKWGGMQKLCWDGYVLFNPGIGHPNLQNQWRSTLQFVLATRKPILFTAHSALDAERDCAVLSSDTDLYYGDRGPILYVENQYASRLCFVDPFPSSDIRVVHIVRPNHYNFFIR